MIKVLVTGANGQLGSAIQFVAKAYEKTISFVFCSSSDLDITNIDSVLSVLKTNSYNYCINCAAYTNVDKAEENEEQAYAINSVGAKNLAIACSTYNITLVHISTDFVFSGKQDYPYVETDKAEPLGVYGSSKLNGEKNIKNHLNNFYIIRTSWLYSEFGSNFMKSMLKLGIERKPLSVVRDQLGSPTYAVDLSKFIIYLIENDTHEYGLYHYTNEGHVSWYDFAKVIFEKSNIKTTLIPIASTEYPTLAKRPSYSVLDNTKVKKTFSIEIPFWKSSLQVALERNDNKV